MKAYKLVRLKANGQITPLHINRKLELPIGQWLEAETHPTKGFAERTGWHCAAAPFVPHMKEQIKGENRVWVEVEIEDVTIKHVPAGQGSEWYLAGRINHKRIMTMAEVRRVRQAMGIEAMPNV